MSTGFLGLIIHAAVLHNLVLAELLGVHEFIICSQRRDAAWTLARAFFLVLVLTVPLNACTWHYLLIPLGWQGLALFFYALNALIVTHGLLALLVRWWPGQADLWHALLPFLLLNSLLLGGSVSLQLADVSVLASIPWGIGSGLGLGLAWLLFTSLRGRIQVQQLPEMLRGLPITLVTLGIMAMAWQGLANMLS